MCTIHVMIISYVQMALNHVISAYKYFPYKLQNIFEIASYIIKAKKAIMLHVYLNIC